MPGGIEAVFFDMDNTLVETEWASARALRLVVEELGGAFEQADEDAVVGLPWATIFAHAIEKYRLPLDTEQLKDRVLRRKALLLADDPHVLPGAVAALRRCAARWPVAVVSGSYRHEVAETVEALEISGDIRFFVANEDCIPGKPAPGPYLLAAQTLGVNPRACLVFEDSEVGVAAACDAGMFCVAVEIANTVGLDISRAHRTIPSLESVTDIWLDNLDREIQRRNL